MSLLPWLVAAVWLAGFLLFWKVPLCRAAKQRTKRLDVSLIIPARNEAENLPRLLMSIEKQELKPREVIVVDDQSEDETAAIARQHGALVLQAGELPDGWRGKTWACSRGAEVAQGAWLVFMDADTWLCDGALAAVMEEAQCRDLHALSIGPYHVVHKAYEQGSAIFNLMTYMGLGCFSVLGVRSQPGRLFGPFMMIRRDAYDQIGGHSSVRSQILEHMHMGKKLREKGLNTACLGGRNTLHIRMYPDGFRSLVEGWMKAFAGGAQDTPPGLMSLIVLWISGAISAFLLCLLFPFHSLPVWGCIFLYALYVFQMRWMLARVGTFTVWTALLYPFYFGFFFLVFGESARHRLMGKKVTWRGRAITSG